jgi:hypothetical protein
VTELLPKRPTKIPWYLQFRTVTGWRAALFVGGAICALTGFSFVLAYMLLRYPGINDPNLPDQPVSTVFGVDGGAVAVGGVLVALGAIACSPRSEHPYLPWLNARYARLGYGVTWLAMVGPLLLCASVSTRSRLRGVVFLVCFLATVIPPWMLREQLRDRQD